MIKKYLLLFILATTSFAARPDLEQEKKYIVSGSFSPGSIFVFDPMNNNLVHQFDSYNQRNVWGLLYFENNGTMQILARLDDPTIVIYNLDGTIAQTFSVAENSEYQTSINSFGTYPNTLALLRNQDGSLALLVGYRCGKIALWDIQTGLIVREFEGPQYASPGYGITAFSLYVDQDANKKDVICLAASSCDGTVCIFDFKTGTKLKTFSGSNDWVSSVAVFKDNEGFNVVAGSYDKTIRCWDIKTEELKYTINAMDHFKGKRLQQNMIAQVQGFVLFKNKYGIFIASIENNNDVVIYNAQTGVWNKSLSGHTSWIFDLRVYQEHSDTYLISSSMDSTVRLWNFASGEQEFTFQPEYQSTLLAARSLSMFFYDSRICYAAALADVEGKGVGGTAFIDVKSDKIDYSEPISKWMQSVASFDQNYEPKSHIVISPNMQILSYIGMYDLANIQVIDVSSSQK